MTFRVTRRDALGLAAAMPAVLALGKPAFADPLVAYDKRLFGEWAHDLLGAAFVRMGRRDLAASAFAKASACAPDNLGYRAKAAAFGGAGAKAAADGRRLRRGEPKE